METANWPELTRNLSAELRNLRGGAPEVMKAFSSIAQAALAQGALDPKSKELIALGISVAIRCDDCIAFHVKAAVDHAPRARKSSKRSAWRSIWAPVRRRCTPAMRSAPIRSSPPPRRPRQCRLTEEFRMFKNPFSSSAASGADTVEFEAFVQAVDAGEVAVVDVREPHEFAAGHIPESVNLPLALRSGRAAVRQAGDPDLPGRRPLP